MSALEVRKLWCAVAFHAVAALCVAWSLYVLVERSVEEARRGFVDWSFWTKLIVVVIGSTGGLVFMYIQCKAYITLCRKWRAFNRYVIVDISLEKRSVMLLHRRNYLSFRVIFIQNAPEKVVLPPSPTDSLREVTLPLKDPTASMPELNRTLLPRTIDPPCASQQQQMAKPDSTAAPQRHDAQLKLYVFDKLSSSEDNL